MKNGMGLTILIFIMVLFILLSSTGSPIVELQGLMAHSYFRASRIQTDTEQVLTGDNRHLVPVIMKLIDRIMLKLATFRRFQVADENVKNYSHPFIPAIIILIFFRFFQNSRSTSGSDFSMENLSLNSREFKIKR